MATPMPEPYPFSDEQIERLARRVVEMREAWEFDVFWLGVGVAGEPLKEATDEQRTLRREMTRRIALRVLELRPDLDTDADLRDAQITIRVPSGRFSIYQRPEYVYGRYLKLGRDFPQTKWPCRRCAGPKCPHCGGTGKVYPTSVEEMIAEVLLPAYGAESTTLLAIGREDVDVRHLGRGRPFALELHQPRRRRVDPAPLEPQVRESSDGRVAVRRLRRADGALVAAIKAAQPDKTYHAACRADGPVDRARLAGIGRIRDLLLDQRTPRRVAHRRADLVRKRYVRRASVFPGSTPDRFEMRLTVQTGTYIKEFVSGDDGRTRPSVSEMLGVACECVALDVVDVDWREP